MREDFKARAEVTEIYVHTTEIRGREDKHAADYEAPTLSTSLTSTPTELTSSKLRGAEGTRERPQGQWSPFQV